jgi:hypothetical protein
MRSPPPRLHFVNNAHRIPQHSHEAPCVQKTQSEHGFEFLAFVRLLNVPSRGRACNPKSEALPVRPQVGLWVLQHSSNSIRAALSGYATITALSKKQKRKKKDSD